MEAYAVAMLIVFLGTVHLVQLLSVVFVRIEQSLAQNIMIQFTIAVRRPVPGLAKPIWDDSSCQSMQIFFGCWYSSLLSYALAFLSLPFLFTNFME